MRHAMLGMGGVGGYFGAKLCQGGAEVHFLVRTDALTLRRQGLRVISPTSPMHIQNLHVYDRVADIPPCDIVWVALKAVNNGLLPSLLPTLVRSHTLVIMLQNGLDPEADAACVVGAEHVAGGACLLMAAKSGFAEVTHFGGGTITLGHYPKVPQPWARARMQEALHALQAAGVAASVSDDLASVRWQKLAWNVPFNGLSALLGANTQQIMRSPAARARAEALMREVMRVAAACGSPQAPDLVETLMAMTATLPDYATSMKWDVERGQPVEVEAIVERPIAAAHAHGVQVPAMEFLRDGLQFLSGG